MTTAEWNNLISDLLDTTNSKVSLKAGKAISKYARPANLSELYALLESDNFYVREMVAVPIARLDGVRSLPRLFNALQRGEQEGHDNDSLTNTLIGLLEQDKSASLPFALSLLESEASADRADAAWALGFLAPTCDPKILFKLYLSDPDAEVRQIAADALQAFLGKKVDKTGLEPEAFNGTWVWQECEPHLKYSLEIKGDKGICILSNSVAINTGDCALKIQLHDGLAFIGEHLFTNGVWYPVTAKRLGTTLHLQGGGLVWSLEQGEIVNTV